MPDCNCTILPWSDDCFNVCIEKILRKATPEQKRNILHIRADTASAIFNAYQRYSINSFEDLAEHLSLLQIQEIISVFRNLTQEQLNYFL
jgi:hypothetical protein